jgi:ATP-dependent exoDNAse (exonuclease V) alpha subunit
VGDVIQPERDYPKAGLSRGVLYEVMENGPGNRLTVRGEKGEVVEFSPMTCRRLSVYEPERSELAAGDRVRITRNDAALDLANGDRFTVAAVSPASVTLTDGKRRVELPADRPLHIDHAYATTVHASQGTTAERVLIDATTRSRTTSQDVYYVAISRARQEARIYTDDLARLPAAVAREHAKHAALDLKRE